MNETYSPEQQQIRSDCLRWRRNVTELVRQKKWDLVEANPCPSDRCTICQNPVMGATPMRSLFTFSIVSDMPAVQEVIERVYGTQTPDQWYRILIEQGCNLEKIKYFVERQLIDVNNSCYPYTIFTVNSNDWSWERRDLWDYLLVKGYDINLQDSDRDSTLLRFLRDVYYDGEDYYDENREESYLAECNENIRYMLEKGADPLLENKSGLSALEYVRTLNSFTESQKERILQLIESYA